MKGFWEKIKCIFKRNNLAGHLALGNKGEELARRYLLKKGMQLLATNYRYSKGEIDLVLKDGDCIVFAEVKTRSSENWERPAAAVDFKKQAHIIHGAFKYLQSIGNPRIPIRFDIVEVILNNSQGNRFEIRHIENAFQMSRGKRYG
jgi:putative endonuclease